MTARSIPSTLVVASLVAGMLLAAPPAPAQGAPRMIHVGIAGGVSVPTGDVGEALKNGFVGQGFVSLHLPGLPIGLRGTVNYERFDFESAGLDVSQRPEGNGSLLSGLGNATISFEIGPLHPYILAGLGAFRVAAESDSAATTVSRSEVRFGINGGAGVQFALGSLHGFIEGRVENIYTDKGFSSEFKNADTRVIPVTIGLMY